jgi:hypothetical protein
MAPGSRSPQRLPEEATSTSWIAAPKFFNCLLQKSVFGGGRDGEGGE